MVAIAVLAGSVREGSFNCALAGVAAARLAAHGASVSIINLAEHDLPIYNAALEGRRFPDAAVALKDALRGSDGMLIVSPEHNGSLPALLKNALDWASRSTGEEPPLALTAFRGKPAAIMSASVSPFGGLRGLFHLRQILTTMQMLVLPEQVSLPLAHTAFGEDGGLTDAMTATLTDLASARLVDVAARLR